MEEGRKVIFECHFRGKAVQIHSRFGMEHHLCYHSKCPSEETGARIWKTEMGSRWCCCH